MRPLFAVTILILLSCVALADLFAPASCDGQINSAYASANRTYTKAQSKIETYRDDVAGLESLLLDLEYAVDELNADHGITGYDNVLNGFIDDIQDLQQPASLADTHLENGLEDADEGSCMSESFCYGGDPDDKIESLWLYDQAVSHFVGAYNEVAYATGGVNSVKSSLEATIRQVNDLLDGLNNQ